MWWIPAGMALGGALGMALSEDPEAPALATEADIRKNLPDQWKQILKNRMQIQEAERLLNERRSGPTQLENISMSGARGNIAQQQSNMGLLGTSVGNAQLADAYSRMQAQVAERAMGEEMQRRQYVDSLLNRDANMLNQSLGRLDQRNAQIYQGEMDEAAARNQFYSGLISGGIGAGANMYTQNQNLQAYQAMNPPRSGYGYGAPTSGYDSYYMNQGWRM